MNRAEYTAYDREGQLVENILAPLFELSHADKIINWAEDTLATFNSLPKANSQDRKIVRGFMTQVGSKLLQNPEDLEIAARIWKGELDQTNPNNKQGAFYELMKKEVGVIFKENWQKVSSEQLAQLVRTYSHNISIQDFAQELLRGYFRGPQTRRQRVEAYYNFTSLILDLSGDTKTFNEALKICLHDKDIVPKDPYLIEQSIFISLPYGEEERVLQQALASKYIIEKLSATGSDELKEVRLREKTFIATSKKLEGAWKVEQARVAKKIGRKGVMRLNGEMNDFEAALAEGRKDEESRVYKLFSDPNEPLNIKFKRVFPELYLSH